METIEIDPVMEMQYLQSMYKHYKNLYRQIILLCCSSEKKFVKEKRDYYKAKIDKAIDLKCQNV